MSALLGIQTVYAEGVCSSVTVVESSGLEKWGDEGVQKNPSALSFAIDYKLQLKQGEGSFSKWLRSQASYHNAASASENGSQANYLASKHTIQVKGQAYTIHFSVTRFYPDGNIDVPINRGSIYLRNDRGDYLCTLHSESLWY